MEQTELLKTFGDILREARFRASLSRSELAGTKQSSIARAENGDVTSIRFIMEWAEACNQKIAFHHVSVGKPNSHTMFFLGGMK